MEFSFAPNQEFQVKAIEAVSTPSTARLTCRFPSTLRRGRAKAARALAIPDADARFVAELRALTRAP